MTNFKLIKWNSGVNAVVCFILGICLLLFPIESLSIGGYLIASFLMLTGVAYIIKVIKNKGIETNGDILYLIISIGFVVLSISIFVDPTWIIRLINLVVGLVLIIGSVMNMLSLLKFKKDRTTSYWIYFSLIILVFILGIIVLVNPLFLAKIITRLEGLFLIINTLITVSLGRKVNTYMLTTTNKNDLEKI